MGETAQMRDVAGRSVLEGAFALLEAVRKAGDAGLGQLSLDSGLPKTTTHRLLDQLVGLGAIERSRGRYRMGPRVFRLGLGWDPYPKLREAARHPIRDLARMTGATVGLCTLWDARTMLISGVPGEVEPMAPLKIGGMWPWHTAAGKLLTAGGHPEAPHPDRLPPAWTTEAKTIMDRGVCFDHEEIVQGITCVAVPLHSPDGDMVAALFAAAASRRRLAHLTDLTLRAGRSVGARLRSPVRREGMPSIIAS